MPLTAGNQESLPYFSDCDIAGSRSDQIDAAIITPEANPIKDFCSCSLMLFLIKKTIAEPSVVPMKGIKIPKNTSKITPLN